MARAFAQWLAVARIGSAAPQSALVMPPMNFASDNTAGIDPAILDAIVEANARLCARLRQRRLDARARAAAVGSVRTRGRGVPGADRHGRECARLGAGLRRPGASSSVMPIPTSPPTNAARRSSSAAASSSSALPATTPRSRRRRCRPRSPAMAATARIRWWPRRCRSPRRAKPGPSTGSPRSRRWPSSRIQRSLAVHMDGARFANALVRLNATPAQMTWRAGVDVLSFGATKGGALAAEAVVIFDPARAAFHGRTAQARRTIAVEAPLHRRAIFGLSRRRLLARSGAPRQSPWPIGSRNSSPRSACDRSGRSKPIWCLSRCPRALDAKLKAAGATLLRAQKRGPRYRNRQRAGPAGDVVCNRQPEEIDRFVGVCKSS